jgi:hypothetical protein
MFIGHFAVGCAAKRFAPKAFLGPLWWGFVLFLIVGYLMNLRGVPPPNVTALAWNAGIAGALTILWGWWADRHRTTAGDR